MIQGIVAGLISGGAYALLGVCIVLLYRMVGVLNLAQAAVGMFGTLVMLIGLEGELSLWLAILIGLAAGGALSAAFGAIMARWFAEAPITTRSSVTIAILLAVLTIGWRIFGNRPRPLPEFFGGIAFPVLGVIVPLNSLIIIAFAVLLSVVIYLFLQHTATGLQLRAISERPTAADLLGVPSQLLAVGVWTFTGIVASFATMMIAQSRAADITTLSLLVVPALGAALVGVFRSFSLAILSGLGIGMLEGISAQFAAIAPYKTILWLLIIIGALLWTQRKEVWDAQK